MSFMVLNTGRVASQFFYINLKLQKNIIMPSRYQFDNVVKSYIKRRYRRPLENFKKYKENEVLKNPGSTFGIVFHSARRNLIYPLNAKRNIEFLKICKDELQLDTIFFPVRGPEKVFHSELNRQLARIAGDWAFLNGKNGWKKKWKFSECEDLKNISAQDDNEDNLLIKNITQNDLKEFSKEFIIMNSKIFSLYNLFKNVFKNVVVFDYSFLFRSPELVFDSMGREADFPISDLSLIKTKLNSLPNRFLIYNSFILQIDKSTEKSWNKRGISENRILERLLKTPLTKTIRTKQNPFLRFCRFKFEISKVIDICEDWGQFKKLVLIPGGLMPFTQKEIKEELSIGIHSDDILFFSENEIDEMIKIIFSVICPRFDNNFKIFLDYYRNDVYYDNIPKGQLFDKFIEVNKQEFKNIKHILDSSDFIT